MAFVAYRDYTGGSDLQYDAPGAPEVCDFTEKIDRLRDFVRKMRATGGGDGPEDICGGLREALKLGWQGESRHLFLIADAPCYGSKYHDMSDNYKHGDPTSLVPEIQFEAIMGAQNVNCKFLNDKTDKMMRVINGHCMSKLGKKVCESWVEDEASLVASSLPSQGFRWLTFAPFGPVLGPSLFCLLRVALCLLRVALLASVLSPCPSLCVGGVGFHVLLLEPN